MANASLFSQGLTSVDIMGEGRQLWAPITAMLPRPLAANWALKVVQVLLDPHPFRHDARLASGRIAQAED